MSEQFNNPSYDESEQSRMLYGEMIESHFLKAKELITQYQDIYDQQDDDYEKSQILSDLYDKVEDLEVFDHQIKFSAKVRPIFSDEPESVDDLLAEGVEETFVDEDELGRFAYLTDASGFYIIDSTCVSTDIGERVGFIISDNFGNEYCVLPEDINRLEGVDKSDETIIKEIEVFYPKIAKELNGISSDFSSKDVVEFLDKLDLSLGNKEIHSSIDDISMQLGRYATMLANLDDAPHKVVFSGDFSLLDRYEGFRDQHTDDEISLTADLRAISMKPEQNDDGCVFKPELDIIVGMPDKEDGYTALRIPVDNIKDIKSNRLKNIDFVFGSDIGKMRRPEEFSAKDLKDWELQSIEDSFRYNDDDSVSAESLGNRMQSKFEELKINLENMQLTMNGLVSELNDFYNTKFTQVDEITSRVDNINRIVDELNEASKGHLWTYTGEGVVNDAIIKNGMNKPSFGRVDGMFGGYFVAPRNEDDDDEQFMSYDYYIKMSRPDETSTNMSSYFNIYKNYKTPLRETIKFTKINSYIHGGFIEQPPKHKLLDIIMRRDDALESAKESFGENSDQYQALYVLIGAFNLSSLGDDDEEYSYTYGVPVDLIKKAMQDKSKAKELSDLMTESIGFGTTHNVKISGKLTAGESYEGEAELVGVELLSQDDGPVLHLLVDNNPIDVNIFDLEELVVKNINI